jgi:hypothetical protein
MAVAKVLSKVQTTSASMDSTVELANGDPTLGLRSDPFIGLACVLAALVHSVVRPGAATDSQALLFRNPKRPKASCQDSRQPKYLQK